MAYFNWDDKYSVGVREIDDQHRKLVSLVNALYEAMGSGQGRTVVGKVLNELISYTDEHFTAEEAMLEKYGYPAAAYLPHKREHDALTRKVEELSVRFSAGTIGLANEVGDFLKNWLTNHILVVDKKYAPFLASKGVK
jgi:hemerythrin-like metal-binding protein